MSGDFYLPNESDVFTFRRLLKKVDSIDGNGVTNEPENISINPHIPVVRPSQLIAAPPMKFAKVTAMKTVAGAAWTSWAATKLFPAYVEANPCKSDGTGVDTATTLYIAVNSKRDLPTKLITAVNEIIGYIPGDGLLVINTLTMTGQAVEGQGCWHAGSHATPAVVGAASEGTEAAETTIWDVTNQPSGKDGLELWVQSRAGYFDAGNKKLYAYLRKVTLDSEGRVVLVSAETQVEIASVGVTVITDVQVTGLTLQKKTRTAYVLSADAESAWTTWHTGIDHCA